jgi:hypothetical protein
MKESEKNYSVTSLIKKLKYEDRDTGEESRIEHDNQTEVRWKKVLNLEEENEEYSCFNESEFLDLLGYLGRFTDYFSHNVTEDCVNDDGEMDIVEILDEDIMEKQFLLRKTDVGIRSYNLYFEVIGIIEYSSK